MACSTLTGRRYSQAEVKGLSAGAGWPSDKIETMSAIVMAESSGFACAHNGCGENSWGMAQVNLNAHRQYTAEQMCDPHQNLVAAYSIYRGAGNSFRPWGAYTDGRYRRYLNGGGDAITPANNGGSAGVAGGSNLLVYGLGAVLLFLLLDNGN